MQKNRLRSLKIPASFLLNITSQGNIEIKEVRFSHQSICAIGYFYKSPQKNTNEIQVLIDFFHNNEYDYKEVIDTLRYSSVYNENKTYINEEIEIIKRSSPYLQDAEALREALLSFATNHFSQEMKIGMKSSRIEEEVTWTTQSTQSVSSMIEYGF